MAAPSTLPKPGSQAAKTLWDRLKSALDLPRTIVVIEGALDRKTLDDVLQKATRGSLGRVSSMSRAEVVARLSDLFHGHEDTATALMKELDRCCHKERHIVASIDEGALTERLSTYRALDFRRERARLVWALLRDGRDGCFVAAGRILDESFAQLAAKDDDERALAAAATAAPVEGAAAVADVVRERLSNYETALLQQQKELQREVGQKESVERERAELVARLGARENALRHEEQLRRDVVNELDRAKSTIAALEAQLQAVDVRAHAAVVDENERLKDRMRSLERAADRATRVVDLEADVARISAEAAGRDAAHARYVADLDEQLRLLQARERAALFRVDELREQLREARIALSRGPDAPTSSGRIGIFVDDANLSASARRDLGSRLDYRELLTALTDGRARATAVAFVVDSPDTPRPKHDAFVASLRAQGWDVREKRAKVRQDGSRKADWDMGMAMEILDALGDVDVVVIGSGDGDFVPLVKRLQREKKRVEVAAFRASTDEALIAAADGFTGLDGRFRLA